MSLQHWRARFLLAALVIAGALACRTEDILNVAQSAATPTRTPRPTFTPLATPTDIPTVLPTNPPATAVPVVSAPTKAPTKKPTVKPTAKPTSKPPTAPPVVATQPPQPPTQPPFQWTYHATTPGCEHSGQAFIKGAVYNDKNDVNSKTPGMPVSMGPQDGTTAWANVKTDDNGEFTFMLNAKGAAPGTYWVWVTDSKGSRISEVGGPIVMNNLGPDDPRTCWHATIDFYK